MIADAIKYTKEPDNDTADSFGGIPFINSDIKEIVITRENLSEIYFVDKLDGNTFKLTYQIVNKYQHKDK